MRYLKRGFNSSESWCKMLGELVNIPTETLIDMICVILEGGIVLGISDVVELEQIQRELQRRSHIDGWMNTVN